LTILSILESTWKKNLFQASVASMKSEKFPFAVKKTFSTLFSPISYSSSCKRWGTSPTLPRPLAERVELLVLCLHLSLFFLSLLPLQAISPPSSNQPSLIEVVKPAYLPKSISRKLPFTLFPFFPLFEFAHRQVST